jgi:hypothetical protein
VLLACLYIFIRAVMGMIEAIRKKIAAHIKHQATSLHHLSPHTFRLKPLGRIE